MTFTTLRKRSARHESSSLSLSSSSYPPPGIIVDRTPIGRHGGIPAQDLEEDALAGGGARSCPFSSDSHTTKANTTSLSAYLTISLVRKDLQV